MPADLSNTIALFRKLGIDPTWVSINDITIDGYYEVVHTEGKKVYDKDGNIETIFREWPSMEAGLKVLEAFLPEMHERGEL